MEKQEQTERRAKRRRKQAAATAVAAVTSAGVVMGGLFASPDDLLNGEGSSDTPDAVTDTAAPSDGPDGNAGELEEETGDTEDEERRKSFRSRARERIWQLPYGVRALVGLPLWALGWLVITAASALWGAALSPLLGTVLRWILTAAAILLVFAAVLKTIFPDLPLKKILNRRTFLALLIGTAALALADAVVPLLWDGYAKIAEAARLLGATGLLGAGIAVFARRERKRREKAEAAALEEPPEPKKETMEEALRRARELADSVRGME